MSARIACDLRITIHDLQGRNLLSGTPCKMIAGNEGQLFHIIKFVFDKKSFLSFSHNSIKDTDLDLIDRDNSQRISGLEVEAALQQQLRLVLNYGPGFILEQHSSEETSDLALLIHHLSKEDPIVVYASGSILNVSKFQTILGAIKKENHTNPLKQYYKSRLGTSGGTVSVKIPTGHNLGAMDVRTSFFTKSHYLTTIDLAEELEFLKEKQQIEEFEHLTHELRVCKIPGSEDRQYLVFFPAPKENQVRFKQNDCLTISIHRDGKNQSWPATVTTRGELDLYGFIAAYMWRPQNKDGVLNKTQLKTIDLGKLKGCPYDGVRRAEFETVDIEIVQDDKIHTLRLNTMDVCRQSNLSSDSPLPIDSVVLARRLDTLSNYNIFKKVHEEIQTTLVQDSIKSKLNKEQFHAIMQGLSTPGGFLFIQGPPGTGKTQTITEMIVPFAFSTGENTVLLVAPTNDTCDANALRAHARLEDLRLKNPENEALQKCYVIRAHSEDSEQTIWLHYANKPGTIESKLDLTKHADDVPHTLATLRMLSISKAATSSRKTYKTANATISDKRVKYPKLSVGYRMLEAAGIFKTGPKAPKDLQDAFLCGLEQYRKSEVNGSNGLNNCIAGSAALRNWVLEHAVVVSATAANASTKWLKTGLEHVALIIADEATRIPEIDFLGLLVAGYNNDGFVSVGDPFQLGVVVQSEDNPFAKQLKTSFQERLMNAGFPYHFLRKQYRMIPQLSALANRIVYSNRLVDGESVKIGPQAIAGSEFKMWNSDKFGINSNIVLLDVRSLNYKTAFGFGYSRYNEGLAMFGINHVLDIHDRFPGLSIAYLTGYEAQYRILSAAKHNMAKQNFETSKIFFEKVDSIQGLEYDIGIIEVLLKENKGIGFLDEMERINVLTTRFRLGYFVLMEGEIYTSITNRFDDDRQPQSIPKYMEEWIKFRKVFSPKQLTCKYYSKGEVDFPDKRN